MPDELMDPNFTRLLKAIKPIAEVMDVSLNPMELLKVGMDVHEFIRRALQGGGDVVEMVETIPEVKERPQPDWVKVTPVPELVSVPETASGPSEKDVDLSKGFGTSVIKMIPEA